MLGVAQSGNTYHYLNWVPSERGPLVTNYGTINKEIESPEDLEQHYTDLFRELFNVENNGDPICTLSLDRTHIFFSTCFAENNSKELIDWHLAQSQDEHSKEALEFYHYPMAEGIQKMLNIGLPKAIRDSLHSTMKILQSKLNSLGVGIFSAETGARQWFKAHQLESYLIWKMGRKKTDELLFIKQGELISYFGINRTGGKVKLVWQLGDNQSAESIVQEIINIESIQSNRFSNAEQVFLYTSDGSIKDLKAFYQLDVKNLILLNPLNVLEASNEDKFHEYKTLPLAETGNAFRGVDV